MHFVSSNCCDQAVLSRSVASAMISQSPGSPGGSFLDAALHDAVAQAKRIADNVEATKAVQASRMQSKMSAYMTEAALRAAMLGRLCC
eukprot:359839-Chlamydomonas_euryale.AAC.17